MERKIAFLFLFGFSVLGVNVEEEILAQYVSPEVHRDGRVTFRFEAADAKEVKVEGIAGVDPQAMKRGQGGIWEATLGPLDPEIYGYVFRVDGVRVTDPNNRNVKKWLQCESMVEVPGDPPRLHEQQNVPHGTVHRHIYDSKTTGKQRGVFVYTPPGYASDAPESFPLVLLLHGYGDDESAWLEVGRAQMIADNLLAQKKIEPLLIAMPNGHPVPIVRKQSFDDYSESNSAAMEGDLLEDLLPFLTEHYRVKEGRNYRAIVGLSMGGGQSLGIGLKHIDKFAWVGGFSSAAPHEPLESQFAHLLNDVKKTNDELKLLWIGCGKNDFLLERNAAFIKRLNDKGIQHTWHLSEGGHDWSVWRKYLAEFLPLLFR